MICRITGRVERVGESTVVLDVGADADFIETASGIVSELAVPLVSSEGVVGVVDIETFSRLPDGAGAFAADVAAALPTIVPELRS